MSKTGDDAANAQCRSRSLDDVHDLRLTTLLCDLVDERQEDHRENPGWQVVSDDVRRRH